MRLPHTRSARPNMAALRRFGAPRHRHARGFGRGRAWLSEAEEDQPRAGLSDDLKLFAATFASGFLFISIVLA
ncbi:hypothetical protein G7078_09180 [Sphingomonas sinipercae]|uniref:Uncharacterized protein n=1 Tax=Sphingomonas sinipercae TaxID=2714944 RepID=A0A6G7ZPV5_9SPHN|nr:hypothetical protein [Sphingomonas sinipercae]QIL02936.1 hypothetical protein G7078_09180 [Sphingomonas sinipercae]